MALNPTWKRVFFPDKALVWKYRIRLIKWFLGLVSWMDYTEWELKAFISFIGSTSSTLGKVRVIWNKKKTMDGCSLCLESLTNQASNHPSKHHHHPWNHDGLGGYNHLTTAWRQSQQEGKCEIFYFPRPTCQLDPIIFSVSLPVPSLDMHASIQRAPSIYRKKIPTQTPLPFGLISDKSKLHYSLGSLSRGKKAHWEGSTQGQIGLSRPCLV